MNESLNRHAGLGRCVVVKESPQRQYVCDSDICDNRPCCRIRRIRAEIHDWQNDVAVDRKFVGRTLQSAVTALPPHRHYPHGLIPTLYTTPQYRTRRRTNRGRTLAAALQPRAQVHLFTIDIKYPYTRIRRFSRIRRTYSHRWRCHRRESGPKARLRPETIRVLIGCGAGAGIAGIFELRSEACFSPSRYCRSSRGQLLFWLQFIACIVSSMTAYVLSGCTYDINFNQTVPFEISIIPGIAGESSAVYIHYITGL